MDVNMQADVAIVGYGPTSQLLALMLGNAGHKVAVVERWPDLYPLPRAVHFDHEIARLLQAAKVIDEVNQIVEPVESYEWRNAQLQTLIDINWGGMGPSGWPTASFFSQPDLERVLDKRVKTLGNVSVYQGWSGTSLAQDAEGVELQMVSGDFVDYKWVATDKKATLRAKYLIGADGANSMVRQAMGVDMHDLGFAFDWLVVDVQPTQPREWHPKTWQLCDPARPTTVVPGGPGRRRWEFMLLPGETQQDMNRDDVSWNLLKPWDVTPENAKLERHAVYTFRGRWASDWRQGRVMLAGDAAHLMPPFAGQGMCSGMRDSVALAWRLDAILSGKAGEHLLDTYSVERSNHIQEMINFSVELGKVICITDPEVAAARDRDILAARARPDYQPTETPKPRLGAGLYLAETAGSGFLAPQGQVEAQGQRGLFDDVFGVGFSLIAKDQATLDALSAVNQAALAAYGVIVSHIGQGGMRDLDGVYEGYLSSCDAVAVLTRPDFYSFGSAHTAADLNSLVDVWREAMKLDA